MTAPIREPRIFLHDRDSNTNQVLPASEQTLYREDTGRLVGWIESGRRMIDGRGRWTEWGFRPAAGADPVIVRRNISDAYTDARTYAATLQPKETR